ncbi:MAG: amino acid ABC transporter ATP-binding protein [Clostridiales Family XIII bacterium]|jgi:polar amino acid transport system ATP-binding protein|nr:amino acid ABC transporter ATP-binding protein [Clostridiales Family XIII bacterium]
MPILEVKNIHKSFGGVEVLKGVGFSLERGRSLALIGSSGSGKTTLLRCLNFLEKPDAGAISVNGELLFDAADAGTHTESGVRKKRLHFGLVFQNFNLFPQYTALGNVTLARELLARDEDGFKTDKAQAIGRIRDEAEEILARVGLADKMGSYPHELSGGQQQRVAIARALALKPDILCFDEPTSALDPELSGEVLAAIRGLAERDTTMVIATHEMGFAREVSSHIIFLADGVVLEEGAPDRVLTNPQTERLRSFLGAVL